MNAQSTAMPNAPGVTALEQLSFADRVHDSLRTRQVASQIANEGKSLLGVQRLSVLVATVGKFRSRRRCRLLSVSGIEQMSRHSETVRRLQRLGDVLIPVQMTVRHPDTSHSVTLTNPVTMAPVVEQAIEEYVDCSFTSEFVIVPLKDQLGFLVAESFDQPLGNTVEHDLVELARSSSQAIANAIQYERTPLRWATAWVQDFPRAIRWGLLLIGLLVAITLLLTQVRVPIQVPGIGVAMPAQRQHLFAPADAIVRRIHVADGERVEENQLVIELHSPEWALKRQSLIGDREIKRQELTSVRTRRSGLSRRANNGRNEEGRNVADQLSDLGIREATLELELKQLQVQLDLLDDQINELNMKAPFAGMIATVTTMESLRQRPVARGDLLVDCFAREGRWIAEIAVGLDDVAGFLEARRLSSSVSLPVQLGLIASPQRTYAGEIIHVNHQLHWSEAAGELVLGITIELPGEFVDSLSTGYVAERHDDVSPGHQLNRANEPVTASVVARIQCGEQSLGQKWFRHWVRWLQDQWRFRTTIVPDSTTPPTS